MMGVAVGSVSSLIAIGALAYALSLEGKILALTTTQTSLEGKILALTTTQTTINKYQTNICTAVKSFTSLTRTAASGGSTSTAGAYTTDKAGVNSVEGRNYDFITSFTSVSAPTCS